MKAASTQPAKKELLAVIIEVGLENGLDVLASYANGTARYINQSGKMIIWENTIDDTANHLTRQLLPTVSRSSTKSVRGIIPASLHL